MNDNMSVWKEICFTLTQNNDEHVLDVALSCRKATPFPLVLENTTEKPNCEPTRPP